MSRSAPKLEEQFEAFLQESISDDSTKLEKPLPQTEAKPWWLDDESDNEIGKSHNFLKSNTTGPTHSTPNDSDKKAYDNEALSRTAPKESTNKVERLSSRYTRELSTNQKGMRRFEGTLSKDSLEDISEKSEEDSESKRKKMKKKTVTVLETTSQEPAPVIITTEPPQDEMAHTESPPLFLENSHPGQETLEEMMEKQKFFSELEQNASGTLDYGLLNQQLSKTASDFNAVGLNEKNEKNFSSPKEASETPPTHRKPSLLSKVSLMDSMGSSLNTTGTSIQADNGNSPVVSKDLLKEALKSDVPPQKEFSGTVTSQEMEDLHIALQNIDLSSTIPPADISPPDQTDIHRTLESPKAETQGPQVQSPFETVQENDGPEVIDLDTDKLTINDLFTNSKPGPSGNLNNQDPSMFLSSSLEQPIPDLHGFDLTPAVMAQSPDHELSTSVAASMEVFKPEPKFEDNVPSQPKKSTTNMEVQKPNQYSKIPSSGYGPKSLTTSKPKSKGQISSTNRPAINHKSGLSPLKTFTKKNKPTTNNNNSKPKNVGQSSAISQEICPQMDGDCKTDQINMECVQDLQNEVEYWKNKWEEEKQKLLQFKGIIAEMETNHTHSLNQQKQMYEIEIDRLKKSNFVLNSKISKVQGNVSEPARMSSEEMAELQKELSEQQVLLSGYQTENERLYNEAKHLKAQSKVTEDRMFRENQKLLMELSSLKNQLELKENLYPSHVSQQSAVIRNTVETVSKNSSDPPASTESGYCTNCAGQPAMFVTSKISQLESQRQLAQDECELARSQNSILEKTKRELESQINILIHQKEEMRQSLQEVKGGKLEEFQVIESSLKEERDEMKKKLQWYAYNQQLLDQDIITFKQKDKEIAKLEKKIEQLQSETGRRLEENKLRMKEKSAYQSRIQDLERQVREMERIIQKRNPNSLTALFMAAGNLVKDGTTTPEESPSPVMKVLEGKLKKLEAELEMRENMDDKQIRSVEQKYNKLKFQYEEQIENLEQQVRQLQQKCSLGDHPHSHRLALEKELENVRERHRNETEELQVQLDQLRAAVDKLKKDDGYMRTEMDATREREKEIQAQNKILRKQLENSNQQVTMLRTSVSRLQREKKQQQQQLIRQQASSARQNSNTFDFNKKQKTKKNDSSAAAAQKKSAEENRNFTERVGIPEEILEENESLKTELDQMQLTIEQQNVDLYKTKAESDAALWKMQEKQQVQINALRLCHQRELQQILTEQTMKNSTNQIPELMSKVDAQQILINHLKEQLASSQVDSEKLSTLKIREVILENEVQHLEDALKEAKKSFSPDRRHFENLVNKIQELENKHTSREKELQNVMKNGLKLQAPELEKEVYKWKRIAESKNQDIENYRVELDSILNILQNLQKQGFIISGNGLKALRGQNRNTSNHLNVS